MGEDSVRPFLEYPDKWTIVLGLTSNKGSADFQQLKLAGQHIDLPLVPNIAQADRSELLYQHVLKTIAGWGNPDNLMFVIGATQAAELAVIRSIIPEHFLLVPGIGFQGGSLADVCHYGLNTDVGLLINASRAIIYASEKEDFAEAAAEIAKQYQVEMAGYMQNPLRF
jgi:orotidine-5'-phosphate decarboxylase